MWGGKKERDSMRNYTTSRSTTSSNFSDQAIAFENEVCSRCSCDVYVSWVGRDITVEIYGKYASAYTLENDKAIVRQLFNKYVSNGRLFIKVS